MSIINKKIIVLLLVTKMIAICGQQTPVSIPTSFNIIHDPRYLYNSVPPDLSNKVTHYRALLQQTSPDEHSCGHRALFHALGLEYATQKNARYRIPLSISIRSLFSNVKSCKSMISKVNKTILEENPLYDINDGTYGYQLARAGNLKFPLLKDKLLPVYLHDDELKIVDTGISPTTTSLNADKFTFDYNMHYKSLSDSAELFLQLSKLRHPFDIVHFPSLLDNQHWVLASIMLNTRYERRLLIVDSCNTLIRQYPSLRTLITLLNEEMKKI